MNLSIFPKRSYTPFETPIEFLANLTKLLGGPNIYIKRDDMLGLAGGGNKSRKLEFLMADALQNGADTIITCGGIQSNHCRLTLAAANKEGLACQLIVKESVPNTYSPNSSGNNYLFHLLGAENILVASMDSDFSVEMEKLSDTLKAQGRNPYIIPMGGSNALGSLGYVACAQEIMHQVNILNLNLSNIITPSGSAGTQSGLLAGMVGNNMNIPITGISIMKDKNYQSNAVFDLAVATTEKLGLVNTLKPSHSIVFDDYVGGGYTIPTDGMVEAVQLIAKTEAILLDPVYTGKAMSGLIDLIRKGYFKKGENILFVHTGGSPALYVYQDILMTNSSNIGV